ncbi:8-amino-7-oxononanoate synthase [Chitinophaga caeni]|uniref:8-amino-7-oxononanoate synthase n=1 Tax=Chitinophaga caeni TaxID=2029983 RepID=A0A291QZP3_9BACT|nr:8-amino-7-oxononanoate synthase [Chitinophaga caeni]ATL49313.1 8-amino-7-oxononanoate synthase [Chitinophaga caeni]
MNPEHFLQAALHKREEQASLRQLRHFENRVDFCSNDYLGLASSERMGEHILRLNEPYSKKHGSGGSRLLSGNDPFIELAEGEIALFHRAAAGLIFNSGYDANLGLLSSVPGKHDTVIYDNLAHASIRDGIRLSLAHSYAFAHNDCESLQQKLSIAKRGLGEVFVVIESVYSMDGDIAPIEDILQLCQRYNAHLIVDEAHATGIVGSRGEGLVQSKGLENDCFARVHTFGKALGCHGAIVLGSETLKSYLINFARSFIYTTALPPVAVASMLAAYQLFPSMDEERRTIRAHIRKLRSGLNDNLFYSDTPIQVYNIPGNEAARTKAGYLQSLGLDVRAILHPTVAKGAERLRIIIHSFNTDHELELLIEGLRKN